MAVGVEGSCLTEGLSSTGVGSLLALARAMRDVRPAGVARFSEEPRAGVARFSADFFRLSVPLKYMFSYI